MFLPVPMWACLPRAVVVGVKPHGQVYRIGFERQRENPSGNPLPYKGLGTGDMVKTSEYP